MKKIRIVSVILAVLLPIMVGSLSAALSSSGMEIYGELAKPAMSPPAWVFPLAWTALYVMMGLASYFVVTSDAEPANKAVAVIFYIGQLSMNFVWSLIFFNMGMYLFAFVWLLLLLCLVILCDMSFFSISRPAGLLMIPYILWLGFAGYLNLWVYLLSAA